MHYREMWNECCIIINAENSATSDKRQRDAAYELCISFRYKLNLFRPNHHHLFRKREHFFRSSTMDTIYMWQNEVYSAIKYKQPKTNKKITSFFPPSNHKINNITLLAFASNNIHLQKSDKFSFNHDVADFQWCTSIHLVTPYLKLHNTGVILWLGNGEFATQSDP